MPHNTHAHPYVRVALAKPLRRCFDYAVPIPLQKTVQAGQRVKVPFGHQSCIGIIVACLDATTMPQKRIKSILHCIDTKPLLDASLMRLLTWVSDYYHHPVGEVMLNTLPRFWRQGKTQEEAETAFYRLSLKAPSTGSLSKAQRQTLSLFNHDAQLPMHALCLHQEGVSDRTLQALCKRGLIERTEAPNLTKQNLLKGQPHALNKEQAQALNRIEHAKDFQCMLLDGVTGSGKTEVYLQWIAQCCNEGHQVLVLVPEIALTPQTQKRFQDRFNATTLLLHSDLNDRQRAQVFLASARGEVDIIIGTRSAVFVPMPRLGAIIVDEEHDRSFKQEEGLRYSAKSVAIMRAKQRNIPILLGSATPALRSLYACEQKNFIHLVLKQRAGDAPLPTLRCIDTRVHQKTQGISRPVYQAISQHIQQKKQCLVFLNRRGFSHACYCEQCGWSAKCPNCDTNMTLHLSPAKLRCHHCLRHEPIPKQCPSCHFPDLLMLGEGCEQIERVLQRHFPDARLLRIDRDTTHTRTQWSEHLERIHQGDVDIIIGTQMLAKGHHFSNVTLSVILDTDARLHATHLDAIEGLGQLITQVAGRSGREQKKHEPGEVLIQTAFTEHPLLQRVLQEGYAAFAQHLLKERKQWKLPPYQHELTLTAQAKTMPEAIAWLQKVKHAFEQQQLPLTVYGPMPHGMPKRAGWFRAQLTLQSTHRAALHRAMAHWLPLNEPQPVRRRHERPNTSPFQPTQAPREQAVRWFVDV